MQETRLHSWVGKIPWRRQWHPTRVPLPGKPCGQGSLAGRRPRVAEWDRRSASRSLSGGASDAGSGLLAGLLLAAFESGALRG